jgi:2-dehydropantoate 2-reductase
MVKVHFFHPPNYISCLSAAGEDFGRRLAGEFSGVGLETRYKENIKGEIYQKVILNCSLSGVCALTRMTMGSAMRDEAVVDIVRKLLLEGMKIAHLEGANLGDDYYHNALKYLSTAGNHKPSMLIDIENGQATEIEYLNYQLIKLAEVHGEFVPFTRSITALVRALDHTVRVDGNGNGDGNV